MLSLTLLFVSAVSLGVAVPAMASSPTGSATPEHVERVTPGVPDSAIGHDGIDDGEARASARLLVAPDPDDADHAWIGVLVDLAPGWHTYWRNSGDTGLPTKLDWKIDGAEVGDGLWPTPTVFDEADGLFTTYGYEDRVLLQNPVRLSRNHDGLREVSVEARLLICKQECIPADFSLRRSFDEALVNSPDGELAHQLMADDRSRLPRSPDELGLAIEALFSQSGVRPGDQLELGLQVTGCLEPGECAAISPARRVDFFPDEGQGIILATGTVHGDGPNAFTTSFVAEAEADYEPGQGLHLSGVLRWETPSGEAIASEIDVAVPWQAAGSAVTQLGPAWLAGGSDPTSSPTSTVATANQAGEQEGGATRLLAAIALALLGGLILNLMPCVLPVLAIKVFAVAELADRERREVAMNGIAYTAGILASMSVLAGVVLGLRSAGTAVGWGFQFQSPTFIAAVSMVLVAFALNLFGTWEIQWTGGRLADAGQSSTGLRRSFFEGLLAVVLSTPCSAPFLGTAVGFAFAGSAAHVVAIFLSIGLGLALPFLVVTLVPGAAAFMPRSGAWMLKLRAGLGFALLATVIWLLWIVGQTGGVTGMTQLIAALLVFAFGLWVLGGLQQAGRSRVAALAAVAVVLVAFAGLNLVSAQPQSATGAATSAATADSAESAWLDFDRDAIDAAVAAGHPVFVAFSADWCITCKVNEQLVLGRDEVGHELDRLGFVRFKADWTRRDEPIRLELARHGRAGVPMYLVYDPSQPNEPRVLPEILSTELVVEALARAAGSMPARASTDADDQPKKSS